MKRTVFIITGSIVLLLIFSLWVYLLLFGAPKELNEAFTNLGFGNPTPIEEYDSTLEQTAQLNIAAGSLSQLTTRPVAGFAFLEGASSTERLRYAERGTGHIYEIDLTNGTESRVSSKTYLAVTDAVFSPDGQAVTLFSEGDTGLSAKLEELGERNRSHDLPARATNPHFVSSTTLHYLLPTEGGAVGYTYDLDEMTTDEIFFIPMSDVHVWWTDTNTWIHNKPAPRLRGGLYKLDNGSLTRVGQSGYTLSAVLPRDNGDTYLITAANLDQNGILTSTLATATSNKNLPLTAFPEKCALQASTLWCASTALEFSRETQSDWYKGLITFSDNLWTTDVATGRTVLLDNLLDATGREIDVIDLTVDSHSDFLLFKNKRDDTLWLRKLPN